MPRLPNIENIFPIMSSSTPKSKKDLSEKRRLLIEKKLSNLQQVDMMSPRNQNQPVALSFAQQRLWFLDQLLPNTPLYNIFSILHFPIQINKTVLHKSLHEIVRRQESLRTHFGMYKGEPVQIIEEEVFIPLPVIDISHLDKSKSGAELQKIVSQEVQKPFQLSTGPLIRTSLVKMGANDYFFLLSMHHIITDGWSMNIFFKELSTLYEDFSRGLPGSLPNLKIQYADYSVWQRQWLKGNKLQVQLDYWKEKLAGYSTHHIPTDYPRSSVQTFNGTLKNFAFSSFFSKALKDICQKEQVTMFMVLLAIFKILVFRMTGQRDILVGSPISGRTRTELEGIIGFFVNTLIFRTQIDQQDSFLDVLQKVKQSALEAYSHQDLPFEMLVEQLHPERNLSRNPLFQVMFQVLSNRGAKVEDKVKYPEIDTASAKFDLTISFNDYPKQLTGSIEYNTDLFKPSTVQRLIEMYRHLVQQVIESPSVLCRQMSLVPAADYQQAIQNAKDARTPYPAHASLAELFHQTAAKYSDKIACIYGENKITYSELDQKSSQFAHYLVHHLHLQREDPVGICLERSTDFIISILGIIKAGACYLPLDLDYPEKRLALMVEDAQVVAVISNHPHTRLLENMTAPLIILDEKRAQINAEPTTLPQVKISSDMLAYIMYTSGSTGTPKGISIPHKGIIRLVSNTNYVHLRSEDTIAQASNTSFDASTFEIWGTLLHGATMIGIEKTVSVSPKDYFQKIEQHGINTLFLTTALFNQFAQQAPWAFRSMNQVLFGGEAVNPKWVHEIMQNSPLRRLLHVYGPTESTTFATWFQVGNTNKTDKSVPIGRPISNTHTYILDAYLELVPKGVPGELYIGGDGLARGYRHKPAHTAAHFLPDPFSPEPGARMYRTKDIVKEDENGNIVFIGRVDNQVKLRGFRIELGEIEAHLKAHDQIKEAVVLLKEYQKGNRRLIGYLLLTDQTGFSVEELKNELKRKIPEYMIPRNFIILDKFPITPNGKVDHKKLPEPAPESMNKGRKRFAKAATKTQQVISDIWKEVLNVQEVSIHDNFFDIGGHSLLIAQVNNRLQERLGRDIPLIDLFQFPTISSLSIQLEATAATDEVGDNKKLDHIQQRISKQKQALQLNKRVRGRFR